MKTTYDWRHILRNKRTDIIDATLIFMSVDFRNVGYVQFTGIKLKLNLEKKVFESNKE